MGDPFSHHPALKSLGNDPHNQASSQADSTCGNQSGAGSTFCSVLDNFGRRGNQRMGKGMYAMLKKEGYASQADYGFFA